MNKKIMLDTNIYDYLVEDREFYDFFNQAKINEFIAPFVTNIQIDQIKNIPDNSVNFEKKSKLFCVINTDKTIETCGFFSGLSRYGWAKNGFDNQLRYFLFNKDYNHRNKSDALIASTALTETDIFVTNDKSLKNRYILLKRVMDGLEFKKYLGQQFAFSF